MRRSHNMEEKQEVLELHGILIDTSAYRVTIEGNDVELTKTEDELLHLLIKNAGIVLQRETILDHVWGYESEVQTNVVDVYISYLRKKLQPMNNHKYIDTARGAGYVIGSTTETH